MHKYTEKYIKKYNNKYNMTKITTVEWCLIVFIIGMVSAIWFTPAPISNNKLDTNCYYEQPNGDYIKSLCVNGTTVPINNQCEAFTTSWYTEDDLYVAEYSGCKFTVRSKEDGLILTRVTK